MFHVKKSLLLSRTWRGYHGCHTETANVLYTFWDSINFFILLRVQWHRQQPVLRYTIQREGKARKSKRLLSKKRETLESSNEWKRPMEITGVFALVRTRWLIQKIKSFEIGPKGRSKILLLLRSGYRHFSTATSAYQTDFISEEGYTGLTLPIEWAYCTSFVDCRCQAVAIRRALQWYFKQKILPGIL